MSALTNVSSYLEGPYAPVDGEDTFDDLPIIGELPPELSGMYVQNNANPALPPVGPYHWFDGDGMVHGVHLHEGRASYRNRWIRTEGFLAQERAGRRLSRGILEPFDPSSEEPDQDTANTDLVFHQGKLLALWWLGGTPMHLSVPELSTLGAETFGDTLVSGVAAHPKVDPVTGEMVFMDYSPYRQPYLRHGVVSADGRQVHDAIIEVPEPSLFHDLAITPRFTVLLDFPMIWDPAKLAQGKRRTRFSVERPARFGVVPRFGGNDQIRWFEAPSCYCYHTINAWEEVDDRGHELVHFTACRIDNPVPGRPHAEEAHVPRLYFLRMDPFLWQWTLDLTDGTVSERQLDDVPTEFPRMNDAFLGRPARYAWHPRVARRPTLLFDGIVKYDLQSGGSDFHHHGEDHVGGEPVFVARPGATAEDDGWLSLFVTDLREGRSELRVLDAQDMAAPPVARIPIPRRVPFGFHAHWAPTA